MRDVRLSSSAKTHFIKLAHISTVLYILYLRLYKLVCYQEQCCTDLLHVLAGGQSTCDHREEVRMNGTKLTRSDIPGFKIAILLNRSSQTVKLCNNQWKLHNPKQKLMSTLRASGSNTLTLL
jgi:hypothetical protein